MKNIWLITTIAPPVGGAGLLRIIKLLKYVNSKKKLKITWLKPEYIERTGRYEDLINEIPDEVSMKNYGNKKIIGLMQRQYTPKNNNTIKNSKHFGFINTILYNLLFPDKNIILFYHFIKSINSINNRPDIIISSSPSNTTHLFAYIARLKYRAKWIMDFRDGWMSRPNKRKKHKIVDFVERYLEKKLLNKSNLIITVSMPLRRYFEKISRTSVKLIYNGYDPEDINSNIETKQICSKYIKIGYAGGLSYPRDITEFVKAIDEYSEMKILVEIWGGVDQYNLNIIGKSKYAKYMGQFKHKNIQNIMEQYDWLLLIGETGTGAEANYGSKLFEYIALSKPIIGLVPESAAKELIQMYSLGLTAFPRNIEEIRVLLSKMNEFKYECKENLRNELLNKFSRVTIAKEMEEILLRM